MHPWIVTPHLSWDGLFRGVSSCCCSGAWLALCYMSGTKVRMLGAAPNEQPAMAFPWGFEPEGFA